MRHVTNSYSVSGENVERITKNGRDYFRFPIIPLKEMVLNYPENGTKEYLSAEKLRDSVHGWNDTAVVPSHPPDRGLGSTARVADAYLEDEIGRSYDTEALEGGSKLRTWGTVDIEKAQSRGGIAGDVVTALENDEDLSVSAGYGTVDDDPTGGEFDGESYDLEQGTLLPDHIAVWPTGSTGDGRRARASPEDGVGAPRLNYRDRSNATHFDYDAGSTAIPREPGGSVEGAPVRWETDLDNTKYGIVIDDQIDEDGDTVLVLEYEQVPAEDTPGDEGPRWRPARGENYDMEGTPVEWDSLDTMSEFPTRPRTNAMLPDDMDIDPDDLEDDQAATLGRRVLSLVPGLGEPKTNQEPETDEADEADDDGGDGGDTGGDDPDDTDEPDDSDDDDGADADDNGDNSMKDELRQRYEEAIVEADLFEADAASNLEDNQLEAIARGADGVEVEDDGDTSGSSDDDPDDTDTDTDDGPDPITLDDGTSLDDVDDGQAVAVTAGTLKNMNTRLNSLEDEKEARDETQRERNERIVVSHMDDVDEDDAAVMDANTLEHFADKYAGEPTPEATGGGGAGGVMADGRTNMAGIPGSVQRTNTVGGGADDEPEENYPGSGREAWEERTGNGSNADD